MCNDVPNISSPLNALHGLSSPLLVKVECKHQECMVVLLLKGNYEHINHNDIFI